MRNANLYPDIHEAQVAKMHQAVDGAERVTIEIGTGGRPLFYMRPRGEFNADHLYIGVNVESLQHKFLAERVGQVGGFAVLTALTDSGMEEVPLPDGCADSVFMHNVFGEPDSPHIMHDFKDRDGKYRGNSSVESKTASLGEARRLLNADGKLVILETLTPYAPYRPGRDRTQPYAEVAGLVGSMGFAVTEALDEKSEAWQERLGELTNPVYPNFWWGHRSYVVTAERSDLAA